jgi:thioredoxin-like negative regulator of GroEL
MDSVLTQLAKDLEGKAIVGKVRDKERSLLRAFDVRSLPTFLIFRNEAVRESFVGGRSLQALKGSLQPYYE